MAKNIVLCSDGTGNSDIKGRGTNVFKLFEAVDLNEPSDQPDARSADGLLRRRRWDEGQHVPARARRGGRLRAQAETSASVRALSRVYDDGDRIYLFGFSRGAFTARTLAGLIGTCGIVKGASCATTRCLAGRGGSRVCGLPVALRQRAHQLGPSSSGRDRQPACHRDVPANYPVHTNVQIEFIGVWDTVDAVGLPFAMSSLVNRFVYQFKFPTQTLGQHVRRAFHALSIDDARQAFEPVLWAGSDERIEQVWFAGAHSNVGGGYPKQGMSLVALDWMLAHAASNGLRLHTMDREVFHCHASVDDMLYDPRGGIGCFYRWAPRDIRKYCNRNGIAPRIHLTVAERIAHATDDYAPGNLPPGVTVATTPVDVDDPRRVERERVLGRRAEAVQTVLQRALGEGYLLDRVETHMGLADASYWFMVVAWLLVALGTVRIAGETIWPDAVAARMAGAIVVAGLICLLFARLLGSYANHAMAEVFSQFWQQHQKHLRLTLKTAHEQARQSSERVDLSTLRGLGSRGAG